MDFDGEFYRFQGASPAVRPRQSPHIPIYISGSSDAAIEVAARHADTYMLWGELLAAVDGHIRRVRAAAKAQGRDPRFSVSFRPIVADTEEDRLEACRRGARTGPRRTVRASISGCATTSRRTSVRSACWPPPSRARCSTAVVDRRGPDRGALEPTALVGTPEQVAAALGEYYRLGVSDLPGFEVSEPLGDAVRYRLGLIPAIHDHIARLPLFAARRLRSSDETQAIPANQLRHASARCLPGPGRRAADVACGRQNYYNVRASMEPLGVLEGAPTRSNGAFPVRRAGGRRVAGRSAGPGFPSATRASSSSPPRVRR